MPYTVVTVSHALDQPLLELQACSLHRFLDDRDGFVSSIVVIDNSDEGELDRTRLFNCYGRLAPRVRFMQACAFGAFPHTAGWFRQQALKLMVARTIETPRYIVLDAKNHLVNPLSRAYLETVDGQFMRSYVRNFQQHPLRAYFESTCRYFRIDEAAIRKFMPPITPFVLSASVVRELIEYVEAREKTIFSYAFLERARSKQMTEFALYAGYLLHTYGDFSDLYRFDGQECPVIWQFSDKSEAARRLAEARESPFLAVHRNAFATFDRDTTHAVARLWQTRGLFQSKEQACSFIEACAQRFG
ncbi:hypothetical protein ABID59_007142 [Bradyrhizobium sp. S3.3.6]|uniref:DUF6492 family protein n=1 Tax=Bradyrhizobium sp. S3.3.6 TaxID=3156429 RepID=UPI0033968F71